MEEMLLGLCKNLKLSGSLVENAKKIQAESHLEFLAKLFTAELAERDRKRRNTYLKAAKFGLLKTFENYSFEDIVFPPGLSVDELMSAAFVLRHENLILYGNVGAGKTHLAIAAGIAACNAGFRTRFWRTTPLVNALVEAKAGGCLSEFMKQFEKLDLLICDEWGYVPIDLDGTKLLFEVVSLMCERKSMIITTNLEYKRWSEIFVNPKVTAAILDRIIYHSKLLDFTNRESRRLQYALSNRQEKKP